MTKSSKISVSSYCLPWIIISILLVGLVIGSDSTASQESADSPVKPAPIFTSDQNSDAAATESAPRRSGTIRISDLSGCTSDNVICPIEIQTHDTELDTFTFFLQFDPTAMDYIDCAVGNLNPGWTMFGCNEVESGIIAVAAFSVTGVIPPMSSGTLVDLNFTITCDGCPNGETSPLKFTKLSDDLADFMGINGQFTYFCTPTSTPNPSPSPIPPTPTPTVTVSPTAVPSSFEISLHMPVVRPNCYGWGDAFSLSAEINNPRTEQWVDFYCVLDILGAYYFYPSWGLDLDHIAIKTPSDKSNYPVIEVFAWPPNVGALDYLAFYAALMEPETLSLISNLTWVEFCYE